MLKVELFDDFVLKEKDLKSNCLDVLLSVDCHMKITIENKTFYEDWICPIEFIVGLGIWAICEYTGIDEWLKEKTTQVFDAVANGWNKFWDWIF